MKRKGADYHHGDLRRSLVEATVRLVAEHGIDGFTLRAAAKLAGVSDGAPYHHFADKEALLAAVAEESFFLLCDMMGTAAAEQPGEVGTKSRSMCIAYVLFAARNPARFRIMWSPLGRGRGRHRGLARAAKRTEELLRQCLDRSLRCDPNRGVPEQSITVARAVLHGLAVLAIDGHLKSVGPRERALKRITSEAIRQLNRVERVEFESASEGKRPSRTTLVPDSIPRSGNRLRTTRQIA